MMAANYKYPILLIEFEEDKSFSLDVRYLYLHQWIFLLSYHDQTIGELKTYGKASSRYQPKKHAGPSDAPKYTSPTVQSKIVLLTISFPRLRIIWSSSPYATSEIFNDLKTNNPEPDPMKAIAVGADDDPDVGAGVNTAAEELLRSLPGITIKNAKHVMSRVNSVSELCALTLPAMQEILGKEASQKCYAFLHKGDR